MLPSDPPSVSPLAELIWICPRPDAFPLTKYLLYFSHARSVSLPNSRKAGKPQRYCWYARWRGLTSSLYDRMHTAGVADASLAIVSAAGVVQGCHNLYRVLLAQGPPLPSEVG